MLLFVATAVLNGCPSTEPWDRLNMEDDCLEVVVSPDDDDDDSADDDDSSVDDDDSSSPEQQIDSLTIDLHGGTGFFDIEVIGTATVTPTRGPAGTRFDLIVVLQDTGTDQGNPVDVTDRVTVEVDNGSITLDEFDLRESPADERRWSTELEAGGTEQTRRTDGLCIALYTEI